jgi:hypothetical protein
MKRINSLINIAIFISVCVLSFSYDAIGQEQRKSEGYKSLEKILQNHGAPLYDDPDINAFLTQIYGCGFTSSISQEGVWNEIREQYDNNGNYQKLVKIYFSKDRLYIQYPGDNWIVKSMKFDSYKRLSGEFLFGLDNNEYMTLSKNLSSLMISYGHNGKYFKYVTLFSDLRRDSGVYP